MAQGTGRKAGGGLARPVQPSADLAKITGSQPLPRSQVVSKVWDHIRKNNLQNPQNKREIMADSTLKPIRQLSIGCSSWTTALTLRNSALPPSQMCSRCSTVLTSPRLVGRYRPALRFALTVEKLLS